jgi:hypothetical protein
MNMSDERKNNRNKEERDETLGVQDNLESSSAQTSKNKEEEDTGTIGRYES